MPFDEEYPILHSSKILHDRFFTLREDWIQFSPNPPYPYYSLSTQAPSVIILPLDPESQILLVREYRHPLKKWIWSLPGGYIDPDEEGVVAGQRELLEETGYRASLWKRLGRAYPYPGISDQQSEYLWASHLEYQAPTQLEQTEQLYPHLFSWSDFKSVLESAEPIDSNIYTALGLFFLSHPLP